MQKDSMAETTGSLLVTSTEDLDLSANVELFHKKALLTDMVNRQLDDLEFQQVKAYVTCRVAIATRTTSISLPPIASKPAVKPRKLRRSRLR